MNCPRCGCPVCLDSCNECGYEEEVVRAVKPLPLWPLVAVVMTLLLFGLACCWWRI